MANSIYENTDYLQNNPNWHEEDGPYKAQLVYELAKRSGLKFSTIADVGCGSGKVTELVGDLFPDSTVEGYDISPDVSQMWQRRRGVKFNMQDFSNSDVHTDLAICLDVFEHVEDYYSFIKNLKERSDYIIFNIPLDMCVVKSIGPGIQRAREIVGHLHYFNDYTALKTLEDCSLRIMEKKLTTTLFSAAPKNIYQWAFVLPRMAAAMFGKRFGARIFGGYSLAVLVSTK